MRAWAAGTVLNWCYSTVYTYMQTGLLQNLLQVMIRLYLNIREHKRLVSRWSSGQHILIGQARIMLRQMWAAVASVMLVACRAAHATPAALLSASPATPAPTLHFIYIFVLWISLLSYEM